MIEKEIQLKENSLSSYLNTNIVYDSDAYKININKAEEVEVGKVNERDDEKEIPTSTKIANLNSKLKYDKDSSSILEIGFDTEFVTCYRRRKEFVKQLLDNPTKEFTKYLKEKPTVVFDDCDENGKYRIVEEYINNSGLNYLISYQYYVHYYCINKGRDNYTLEKWGNVYTVNDCELNVENYLNQTRITLDQFLRLVLSDGISKNKISNFPTKIHFYCHYSKADLPYFYDFWKDDKLLHKLDHLRGTFASILGNIKLKHKFETEFKVVDTMHLSPSKFRKLKYISKFVDEDKELKAEFNEKEKLTKKEMSQNEIENMHLVRKNNFKKFCDYGLTDAKICVFYAELIRKRLRGLNLNSKDPIWETKKGVKILGSDNGQYFHIPITLTGIGYSYCRTIWANKDDEYGLRSSIDNVVKNNPHYPISNKKQIMDRFNFQYFRGRKSKFRNVWKKTVNVEGETIDSIIEKKTTYVNVAEYERAEAVIKASYYGGRNEQFIYGPSLPNKEFYDYDLVSAYPTAMVNLGVINWSKKRAVAEVDLWKVKEKREFFEKFKEDKPLEKYVGFFCIDFKFKDNVEFPTIPVRAEKNNSIIFPKSGEGICINSVELFVALYLGCKITIKEGHIFEWDCKSLKPFQMFTEKCIEKRREAEAIDKNGFDVSFWKEIVCSLYGKTAQGISHSKGRNLKTVDLDNEKLPPSLLTNPAIASLTTSLVRGMLGYLMNNIGKLGYDIWSVTTDGFLTNFKPNKKEWNKTKKYWLMEYWINNRNTIEKTSSKSNTIKDVYADGKEGVVELKHKTNQLIGWRTRGQSSILNLLNVNNGGDLQSFSDDKCKDFNNEIYQPSNLKELTDASPFAKAGLKIEKGFEEEGMWHINWYFFNRSWNMKYSFDTISSLYGMFKEGREGDPIDINIKRTVSMDYDWKRHPIKNTSEMREAEIFNIGEKRIVVNNDGKEEEFVNFKTLKELADSKADQYCRDKSGNLIKHLYFKTKPLKNLSEYYMFKDNWWLFIKQNIEANTPDSAVLKTDKVLNDFLTNINNLESRLKGSDYRQIKSVGKGDGKKRVKGEGVLTPKQSNIETFIHHFIDCCINNRKGIKCDFNEIKPIADFVFHINVLFHYNSVTNEKKMLYVKDRNLKYVKAKKSLALKFGVRKSKWKKKLIDEEKYLKRIPFPFDNEREYCLTHLKEGKGDSKKYCEYFKDLKIEEFIKLS